MDSSWYRPAGTPAGLVIGMGVGFTRTSLDGFELIELFQIRHTFGPSPEGQAPLLDISHWAAAPRECSLIVGPSGAGKSTLLHMMAGLLRPDAGRVIVDGTELGSLSDGDRDAFRSRRIGYLIQGDFFLDSLNVIENVMIGMTLAGMDAKGHQQRARMLLDRVGLGGRAFHSPSVLSGGEGVRLGLARALAADPPLLLADEPTASLDSANARRIADLLDSLVRDEGRTLVVATHDRDLFRPDAVLDLPFVHGGGDSP